MKYVISVLLLAQSAFCFGQTDISKIQAASHATASGNYKDILSGFYQLAIKDLSGPNKEISITGNPYSLLVMTNPKYKIDSYYYKYRYLRNLNLNFNYKLDTNYRFAGVNLGIKYAIINNRDKTVSKSFVNEVYNKLVSSEYAVFNRRVMDQKIILRQTDSALYVKFVYQMDSFIKGRSRINGTDTSTFSFNDFSYDVKGVVTTILQQDSLKGLRNQMLNTPDYCFRANVKKETYDDIASKLQNRFLWIANANLSSNATMFTHMEFATEMSKGMINPERASNLEFNLKMYDVDSLLTGSTDYRNVFTVEPGLNFVLKGATDKKSFFEFKLSGSYYNITTSLNAGEKRDSSTINGVLRLRVYNDIWLPITIKYDPTNKNLFGFLNLTANFSDLADLFKKQGVPLF